MALLVCQRSSLPGARGTRRARTISRSAAPLCSYFVGGFFFAARRPCRGRSRCGISLRGGGISVYDVYLLLEQ